MKDAVGAHLERRGSLERGFFAGFGLSLAGHVLLAGLALGVTLLSPKEPPLRVASAFAVPLPRGGGGTPSAPPPAPEPAATAPAAEPPAPKPEPPPKVIKPPKEQPRRGLPPPDARKSKAKPQPTPPPRVAGGEQGKSAAGAPRGESRTSATPGIEFGPPGPGVPGGADSGDFYLAGVQRKIWLVWTQQIKTGFAHPVVVSFTILADGSVTEVRVVQSSGAYLLELAAQRSVLSAAPFQPLPKDYGTNRYTIQAIFRPTAP